jgi:hypothetical protein
MKAQYKNNDTLTRTMNSKCHRTIKNTEYTTEKTVQGVPSWPPDDGLKLTRNM